MLTNVYVDGFNLYYRATRKGRGLYFNQRRIACRGGLP